jgi:hypothetical protein
MPTILRPMTTGELLDQTFRLYRTNFPLFVGIAALPNLGVLAVGVITDGFRQTGALTSTRGSSAIIAAVVGAIVMYVVYLAAIAASQAATVAAVSAVHLDKPITIGESFSRIKKQLPRLMGVMIGTWIGIGLGFLLLIIPGIILSLKWALAIPVAVVENASLSVATSRSSDLTQGHRGRVFVIAFLCLVLIYIVTIIINFPVLAVAGANAARHGTMPFWLKGVARVCAFISGSLVGPVLTIAFSLMYFDERVRKEGLDLEVLMGDFGSDAASAASASS